MNATILKQYIMAMSKMFYIYISFYVVVLFFDAYTAIEAVSSTVLNSLILIILLISMRPFC